MKSVMSGSQETGSGSGVTRNPDHGHIHPFLRLGSKVLSVLQCLWLTLPAQTLHFLWKLS